MRQMGTVYLYNFDTVRGRQVKMLCLKLGIKIRTVELPQYNEKIGAIAGVEGYSLTGEVYEGEGFPEEMLIMKGFDNSLLNAFLQGFRAMKIAPVALKAILTEGNIAWDSLQLHDELVKEHENMKDYR